MTRATWTPEAVADLDSIVDYIAEQAGRRSVSREVYDDVKAICDQYASYFARGHVLGTRCPEMGEEIRLVTYQRWVILFRPLGNSIEILRVFDGSRDYTRTFRGPGGDQGG